MKLILDEHSYSTDGKIPGILLIINNKTFTDEKGTKSERTGSDSDADRLKQVFEDKGFTVIPKKDLTAEVCSSLHRKIHTDSVKPK